MARDRYSRWSAEEIQESIEERLRGRPTQEIADELGVHPQVLYPRWRNAGFFASRITKPDSRNSAVEVYSQLRRGKSWRQICDLLEEPYTKMSVDKLRARASRMCKELKINMPKSSSHEAEEPEVRGGMVVDSSWDIFN